MGGGTCTGARCGKEGCTGLGLAEILRLLLGGRRTPGRRRLLQGTGKRSLAFRPTGREARGGLRTCSGLGNATHQGLAQAGLLPGRGCVLFLGTGQTAQKSTCLWNGRKASRLGGLRETPAGWKRWNGTSLRLSGEAARLGLGRETGEAAQRRWGRRSAEGTAGGPAHGAEMLCDGIGHRHDQPRTQAGRRLAIGRRSWGLGLWRRRIGRCGGRSGEKGHRGGCGSGGRGGDCLATNGAWTGHPSHVGWHGEHALTRTALKLKHIRIHDRIKGFLRIKKVSPKRAFSTSQVSWVFKKTRI